MLFAIYKDGDFWYTTPNMKTYALKKLFCILLAAAAVIAAFPAFAAAARPEIKSEAAVLIEAESGRVFFEENGSERWYPASTTKVLSSIIAIEMGDLDEMITVGKEVNRFNSSSSLMGIKEGEKVSLRDLLYGMMLASGNDAAATVGVAIGGSLEEFAELMNAKAKELGMNSSHFVNPHGLHDEEHYSTALDMAKAAAYAMKNESFRKIVATEEYTAKSASRHQDEPLLLTTTNKLLHFDSEKDDQDFRYRYATGIKTGSTPAASGCLIASAEKDGVEFIAVVLGDQTRKYTERWREVREMFEYGFDNFASVQLSALPIDKAITAHVSNAAPDANGNAVNTVPVQVTLGDQMVSGLKSQIDALKDDASPIKTELHLDKELVAPIAKGQPIGTVSYRLEDDVLAIVEAQAAEAVYAQEAPPAPTIDLVAVQGGTLSTNNTDAAGPSPLLYVALVLLALLLAILAMRILHVRRMRRARQKRRLAVHRQTGPSYGNRRRTVGNRYSMYSRSRR